MALDIYLDAGLTTPLVGNFAADQKVGSAVPVTHQFWIGDPDSGYTYDVEADPGVTPIAVSITDAAPGTGHESTEIKLATTSGGLAGATAGDPLPIGTSIASGVGGAVEVWMEVHDATGVAATVTELGIETQVLRQVAT